MLSAAPPGDNTYLEPDLGPLAWVLDELRKSLDGATQALRRFVRDAELSRGSDIAALDASHLRIARQQLHQAVGALEMVGFEVPAQMLRAMEALVQKFVQRPEFCSDEAALCVERASFALTDYLAAVLKGKKLSSVALFAQYRDVLQLTGADRIHPADLWAHDWLWVDVHLPAAAVPLSYDSAVRTRIDGFVLNVVKTGHAPAALAMRDISLGFAAHQPDLNPRVFWAVSAAFFEAVALGLCGPDVYTKRAASHVLLQYRTLARGEPEVSERLTRDLLFFCSQAVLAPTQDAPALRAVQQAYGLSAPVKVSYEKPQFGRFDPAVLALARKRVAAAAETWSTLSGGDTGRIKAAVDQFGQVADSVVKLHPDNVELAGALLRAVDTVARTGQAPGVSLAMEVATAVLYLEAAYEDMDPDSDQMVARGGRLAERLDHVIAGGKPEPLDVWMEELYRRVSERQVMGSVVDELRGTLGEVETALDGFFRRPEDKTPLHEVPGRLAQMRGVFSVLGLDQAALAVLRMRDSVERFLVSGEDAPSDTAGVFEKLGNSLGSLGFLIDMLSYQRELAKKLFVYDEVLGEFRSLMGRQKAPVQAPTAPQPPAMEDLPAASQPTAQHALVPELPKAVDLAPVAQAVPALAPVSTPALAAAPVAAPVVAAPMDLDDDDAELRDIFLEEAREVFQVGLEAVSALRSQPADMDQQTTLRRAFHTLKGSSRMVGFTEFGEAAWALEQLLNAWLPQQLPASPDLLKVSQQALQAFGRWIEDVATGQDAPWRSLPFRRAADSLRLEGVSLDLGLDEAVAPTEPTVDVAAVEPLELDDQDQEAQRDQEERVNKLMEDEQPEQMAEPAEDVLRPAYEPEPVDFSATQLNDFSETQIVDFSETLMSHFGEFAPAAVALPSPQEAPAEAPVEAPAGVQPERVAASIDTDDGSLWSQSAQDTDPLSLLLAPDEINEEPSTQLDQPDEAGEPDPLAGTLVDEPEPLIDLSFPEIPEPEPEPVSEPEPEPTAAIAEAPPPVDLDFLADLAPDLELNLDLPEEPPAPLPAEPTEEVLAEEVPAEPLEEFLEAVDEDQVKVIGSLRIGLALYNVYLNEADEWSRCLLTELTEWSLELEQTVPDSAVVLAHSLAGSSGTVGFMALSELARALEHAMEHTQLGSIGLTEHAQLFVDVAEEIRRLLHQFAAGFLKPASPELLMALKAVLDTDLSDQLLAPELLEDESVQDQALEEEPLASELLLDLAENPPEDVPDVLDGVAAQAEVAAEVEAEKEVEDESVAEAQDEDVLDLLDEPLETLDALEPLEPIVTALPEEPVEEPVDVPAGLLAPAPDQPEETIEARDSLDVDLFPIFEEEALELLPLLSGALRQWSARPDNLSARQEALRVLHTLKGSARLAGAMRLGEMAHRMESAVERIDVESAGRAQLDPLMTRLDAISACFEALRATPLEALVLPEDTPAPESLDTLADAVSAAAADAHQPLSMWIDPASAKELAPPAAPVRRPAGQTLRVKSQLIDRMVDQAGEVMMSRSRLESRLGQLRGSLDELTTNLSRLHGQLREMEMQSESQMQSRLAQTKDAAQGFDPLEFDRFTRVQEITRMMAESVHDVATLQRTLQQTVEGAEDDLIAQARQTRELQRDLLRTRMVEFDSISERLHGVVRQAAKDFDKPAKLEIVGGALEMDRGVLERVVLAFEHLLRNAVGHGIEPAPVRKAAAKASEGAISITVEQQSNDVAVTFRDDGAGLNLDRIREKALAKGQIKADQTLSDEQLANLIFTSGLSTASELSEMAGRGIGMDVVRTEVNALGGRIELSTQQGAGTQFKLVLPLTTAVNQVVLFRMGERVIGVPASLVELVRRVPVAELDAAYASGHFDHNGEALAFFWAGGLLQTSVASIEPRARTAPVAIFRSAGHRIALHVDEILGNQEVVVKNLGPQLSRLPGLAGMSVLASGAVVLIYNPVALAAAHGDEARAYTAAAATSAPLPGADGTAALPAAVKQAPLILVVDDSITVRRVTQRLLKREGYRVALANDGLHALEVLQVEKPAVVLSDIEMPRMDGFDLVRNIRADEHLKDLPIIMITSRIAEKHREYARALNVDHYLGKPYPEDELLGLIRGYCKLELAA